MKKFNLKKIAKTVSMVMSLGLASVMPVTLFSTQAQASDIEIYTLPETGQKTIVLMLDTSGSMRLCDTPVTLKNMWRSQTIQQDFPISNLYSLNYWVAGWEVSGVTNTADSRVVSNRNTIKSFLGTEKSLDGLYDRDFCYGQREDGSPDLTKKHPDRMTRLKDAVFELMNSDKLNEDIFMGVGVFTGGKTGSIIVPAKRLTPEHKSLIKRTVAGIGASGGTPTANAYAELAAYMLGTTTNKVMPDETAYYEKELYVQLYRKETTKGTVAYQFAKCMRYNAANPAQCDSYDGHNGSTDRLTNDTSEYSSPLVGTVLPYYGYKLCNATGWADRWCLYDKTAQLIPFTFNVNSYIQEYSGFANSVASSKNGSTYQSPLPTTGRECGGQALYFLTDGYPNTAPNPEYLMKAALGTKGSEMPTNKSEFTKAGNLIYAASEGMAQAGILSKILRDPTRNPAGVEIKTAVVGFGSDFESAEKHTRDLTIINAEGKPTTRKFYDCSKLTISQVKNACNWGEKTHTELPGVGGFGEGGFFYAKNSTDIIQSVLDVVNDIPTKTPDVKTGSPTIPVDTLSQSYINSAYYAEFSPTPEKLYQLWKGTMGKYNIANGILVGSSGEALFNSTGENNKAATALWSAVGKLTLQQKESSSVKGKIGRTVLTNRTITNNAGANSGNLTPVTVDSLFSGAFQNDPHKNYWLNFLGYLVPKDATGLTKANLPTNELRQMGATMHSTPILLTQKGKVVETNYQVSVTDREDYLLYGSTQGALHVIDEKTGEEKFAFVPNEMLENQREALLEATLTTGGRNNLFYGVDAPWTAHTVYAIDNKGYSTVVPVQNTDDDEDQQAHQWVYGGLRMGGRSYYALDLTDINNPAMKFHIDPATGKVYSGSNSKDFPQIGNMGQSWSKPVLGYVNWKNAQGVTEKKLVMFVGGGYDAGGPQGNGNFSADRVRTGYAGYEQSNYNQTNKRGAGVYMFDANNGDLLWWASANQNPWSNGVQYLSVSDMKYSVVSRINAIDRNSDGLIDNLYFGDLGGQAFRVDLNNNATSNANFGVRAVKLFSENNSNGTSPRFYNMPSVAVFLQTAAEGGDDKRFATVSFVSGDMSSPLAGTNKSPVTGQTTVTATAPDGVFVVYDNDLGRSDLYTQNPFVPRTTSTTLPQNNLSVGVTQKNADGTYNRGWKYIYPANISVAGTKKGLNEPYTFVKFLFANMYNKGGGVIKTSTDKDKNCGGGVIGNSTLEMFCMPTGKCTVADHGFVGNGSPSSTNLGAGIVGASLGNKNVTGSTSGQGIVSVTMNNPVDCTTKGNSDPRCQGGPQTYKINQVRWYESK